MSAVFELWLAAGFFDALFAAAYGSLLNRLALHVSHVGDPLTTPILARKH